MADEDMNSANNENGNNDIITYDSDSNRVLSPDTVIPNANNRGDGNQQRHMGNEVFKSAPSNIVLPFDKCGDITSHQKSYTTTGTDIPDDPPPYDQINNPNWCAPENDKSASENDEQLILFDGKPTKIAPKIDDLQFNKKPDPGKEIRSNETTEYIGQFESRFRTMEQSVTETRRVANQTHSLQQSMSERVASIEQHLLGRQPPSRDLSEEDISQRVVQQLVNDRTFVRIMQSRAVSEDTESATEGTPPSPRCKLCKCVSRCTCKCHLTDLNEKWKRENSNHNADRRYRTLSSIEKTEHNQRELAVSDIESDLDVSRDFKNNLSYVSDSDHERPKSDQRNGKDRKMSSLKEKKTEDGVHQVHGASGGDPPSDDPDSFSGDESGDERRDKKDKKEKSQNNDNKRKNAKRWVIDADAWTICLKRKQGESDFVAEALRLLDQGKIPDQILLNEICSKYTRQLPLLQDICDGISSFIKQKSNTIVLVWPAYQYKNEDMVYGNEVIFVVLTSKSDDIHLNEFAIHKRCVRDLERKKENMEINKRESNDRPSSVEIEKLEKCLRENARRLMKSHSKLTRVTASWFKSSGYDTDEYCLRKEHCIALFVHVKGFIPLNEEPLPKKVGNYPVDVREGVFKFCRGPQDYHESVKMGCAIRGEVNQGTLGAFIELENDSRVFGVTSAHVVFAGAKLKEILDRGQIEYPHSSAETVYQPANDVFGEAVAAVYREGGNGIPGMEIALVEIKQKRWPTDGTFPDDSDHPSFGFGPHKPFEFCSGKVGQLKQDLHSPVVYKYGSESKITKGVYRVNGASVRTQRFTDDILGTELIMHDQLEIEKVGDVPFGEHGDSGALVVTHEQGDTELVAVGIFEGKMQDEDVYTVTPMYSVLNELRRLTNKNCRLKKFPQYSSSSTVMNDSLKETVSGLSTRVEKIEDELRKQGDKTDQILQILIASQNKP